MVTCFVPSTTACTERLDIQTVNLPIEFISFLVALVDNTPLLRMASAIGPLMALVKNKTMYGREERRPSYKQEREKKIYLTTHSTHFIYGYMASDIWLRTILIVRKETRCGHIGYCYRLTARVLLYASSHRQDNTYHGLCYTSCGALAGTRNSSMGPPHEGSIRRPIAP